MRDARALAGLTPRDVMFGKLKAQGCVEQLDHRIQIEFRQKAGPDLSWYVAPRIVETASGFVLIDLSEPAWEVQVRGLWSGMLYLYLRRGPDDEPCGMVLNPATKSYQLFDRHGPATPPPPEPGGGAAT